MFRNKSLYETLLNDVLGSSFVDEIISKLKSEDIVEHEIFETTKNGIKTIVNIGFNKNGYPVKHTILSEKVLSEIEQLEKDIIKAAENKDFKLAYELQEKLKQLRKPTS